MNQYPGNFQNMNQYAGNFQPNMYQQFQNMYNNMNQNNQNQMCFNPYMYQQFMNQQNMNMNQQNMNNNNNMNMNQLFAQFMQWLNMNGCNNPNMNVCNNPNMNVCNNQNMNGCNNQNMNAFNNINANNNNPNLNGGNNNITNSGDGKNIKETLPRGDKLVEFKNEYPDEDMENMKNIIFLATSGYRVAIVAPFYETISNILKLYTKKIGIGENTIENEIFFIFDATYLHKNDDRAVNELCHGQNVTITVIDSGNVLGAK